MAHVLLVLKTMYKNGSGTLWKIQSPFKVVLHFLPSGLLG